MYNYIFFTVISLFTISTPCFSQSFDFPEETENDLKELQNSVSIDVTESNLQETWVSVSTEESNEMQQEKMMTAPTPASHMGCRNFKCNKPIFSLYGEWLYFKAIEDSLKYAQTTPQNPTFTPKSHSVEQLFNYTSGFRIGIGYRLPRNNWGISADWMQYHTHNPKVNKQSDDFGILAVMVIPIYGIAQNSQVDSAVGKWSLEIDSIDLKLNMPIHMSKRFIMSPSGGVMAGLVNQKIDVQYGDFLIVQEGAATPQRVEGKNNMWGVGPMIGLDAKFLVMDQLGLFFSGNLSALCGQFKLKTTYKDFLNAPEQAKLTISGNENRVSLVEQIKAGIEWNWQIGETGHKYMEINLSAGWEVQVWTRQMRLNLFDTFVDPSQGADLTFYGPFIKGEFRF